MSKASQAAKERERYHLQMRNGEFVLQVYWSDYHGAYHWAINNSADHRFIRSGNQKDRAQAEQDGMNALAAEVAK